MQLIPTVAFPSSFPAARAGGRKRAEAIAEGPMPLESSVSAERGALRPAGTAEKTI